MALDLQGFSELQSDLVAMALSLENGSGVDRALQAGAAPIEQQMLSNASSDPKIITGALHGSIHTDKVKQRRGGKQISIGVASSYGKAYIHGAGEPEKIWTADHDSFLCSMADAAYSVAKMYEGRIAYINVMANMSVDCDCCAKAEDPCMKDIGILASLDPIALDRACLDLVYASDDPGRDHLIERIESRNGALTVDAAAELGFGTKEYELVEIK